MLPLAQALLRRDHVVLWLTGADACETLEREGVAARAAGFGEGDGMAEFQRRFPEARTIAPPALPDFMFPKLFGAVRAPRMLEDATPIVRSWSPTLIVSDAAELAGPLLARMVGAANATHSFGALLPPHRVAAAAEEVGTLWRQHSFEPERFCGCYESLYLDIFPPGLQRAERSHVPSTMLLRPEGIATRGEATPDWSASLQERPMLYVTLGTVFGSSAVLSIVLEAVSDLAVRVIATVGPRGDPAALGPQPRHVHVARYIAQQEILPRCAAVVSHAGSGTFLAALAAGLPQVCLPQAADQFLNATAGELAGCAIALQPDALDAHAVRAAVEEILANDAYRRAAASVREEILTMPDADSVADALVATYS
jgi:UDP:flavonoid glycosyltransferase YjiC (YdhE family)